VKYVRRNFLCGPQGREPGNLSDLNAQLRASVWEVATNLAVAQGLGATSAVTGT
jgi:hypothetical protein